MPAVPKFSATERVDHSSIAKKNTTVPQLPTFIPNQRIKTKTDEPGKIVSMEPHPLIFIPAGKNKTIGSTDLNEISQKVTDLISTGLAQAVNAAGKLEGKVQEMIKSRNDGGNTHIPPAGNGK